jgi:hypothetical protein
VGEDVMLRPEHQTKIKENIANDTDEFGFGMKIDGINDTELIKDKLWQ